VGKECFGINTSDNHGRDLGLRKHSSWSDDNLDNGQTEPPIILRKVLGSIAG